MAGPEANCAATKIKGGKWTVIRFFFVSLAFTIGWMTVSSLLAHYKLKYGPAVLLEMSIAYFLPSIPLLVISSFLDERLDRKFGIAKTLLMRLLVGLGGCVAVTAAWPFAHSSRRLLLAMVVILGLTAGLAFSASYQMVARFANKNTISLGLGCVGSGIVTLFLELAIDLKTTPTRTQELILFEMTAGLEVLGALAALSLLIRHWKAIERSGRETAVDDQMTSLLDEGTSSPTGRVQDLASQRSLRRSLSLIHKYSPLDPFDTMSDPERLEAETGEEEALLAG